MDITALSNSLTLILGHNTSNVIKQSAKMFSCLALMGLHDMNYNFENISGDILLSRRDHRCHVAKQTDLN